MIQRSKKKLDKKHNCKLNTHTHIYMHRNAKKKGRKETHRNTSCGFLLGVGTSGDFFPLCLTIFRYILKVPPKGCAFYK